MGSYSIVNIISYSTVGTIPKGIVASKCSKENRVLKAKRCMILTVVTKYPKNIVVSNVYIDSFRYEVLCGEPLPKNKGEEMKIKTEFEDLLNEFIDNNLTCDGCRYCNENGVVIVGDDHKGSYSKAVDELYKQMFMTVPFDKEEIIRKLKELVVEIQNA